MCLPAYDWYLAVTEIAHFEDFRAYIHFLPHDTFGKEHVDERLIRVKIGFIQVRVAP